jgi:hypothetical protein
MTEAIARTPVAGYQNDYEAIIELLNQYFDGLYEGDVHKLGRIFHEDAWLKGNDYRKTRDQWLYAVANRPIPTANIKSSAAPAVWCLPPFSDTQVTKDMSMKPICLRVFTKDHHSLAPLVGRRLAAGGKYEGSRIEWIAEIA